MIAGNRGNWVNRSGESFAMEPITERRGGAQAPPPATQGRREG